MFPRRVTLLLVVLATAAAVAPLVAHAQQPPSLQVMVDRDRVTVGDRIAVTVTLRAPEGATPDVSAFEQQFGEMDVLVVGLPEEQALGDGMKDVRVRYEVAAFRTGDLEIPALALAVLAPGAEPVTVVSTPIPITVESVIPPGVDATDVRDLKPQIDLPYSAGVSSRRIAGIAAAALAAAALLGLIIRRLWPRGAPPAAAPVAVIAAAEDAARAELDRISGLGLLATGDVQTLHTLLAACIRRYLSDRFGFPAFAMTTAELRTLMEQRGVGRWQARLTAGLLAECDAVAYARYRPAPERAESNLSMAYEIVSTAAERSLPPVAAGG